MANFILLYSGGSMSEDAAEMAAFMQAWGIWFEKLGGALVDGGHPFAPVVKSIGNDGSVSDNPVGSLVTGYSIIKAESLNAAVELARSCPVFQSGAQITVYEAVPVM
jgi:hypothetical protein